MSDRPMGGPGAAPGGVARAGGALTRRRLLGGVASAALVGGLARPAAAAVAIRAASHLPEQHVYTRTLRQFLDLVARYAGEPVQGTLHPNGELGGDKDYFIYMNQGISVDCGIISPAHMSTFARSAPLMDLPYLFRDAAHWERALSSDALRPVAEEVLRKADVMVLGYAGGGVRNVVCNRAAGSLAELRGLKLRVQSAPVHARIFQALGMAPSPIAYPEVYNAIQSGVINGLENEAAGIEQMKFFEVAPHVVLTRHNMTVRPLCFSGKTFRRLPPRVQEAVMRAGREASLQGRRLEAAEDESKLQQMVRAGRLRLHEFADHAEAQRLVRPVQEQFIRQIGAEAVVARLESLRGG